MQPLVTATPIGFQDHLHKQFYTTVAAGGPLICMAAMLQAR